MGELRFRPPVRPSTNRSAVQDGSELRICPQANPAWSALAAQWLPQYLLTGQAPNISLTTTGEANVTTGPAETEDCLFLDVIVPQAIFEKAGRGYGAPVLVWMYGECNGSLSAMLGSGADSPEQAVAILRDRRAALGTPLA